MPIAESPSYHGYDVVDYYTVDREYGTNDDFKRLMREAHRRGIHVLVDMVLNHSSSEHPWFLEAARNPNSPHRDWYLFSAQHPGVKQPVGERQLAPLAAPRTSSTSGCSGAGCRT